MKYEEFEIYINDLVEEKQKELLNFLGIKSIEEGNYDVFPISIVPKIVE